ncbi:hypothetical protein [Epilithonimonas arachidiradicis]|uniref:Uncharacterized protein n=1 Tax=Epilithonimonas arachidiradicis TaxID=1617282 RepID=A0A420DBE0_9FLAO|nr:hypothetical protein [Epilithonimonas arachidiradicis]RKE88752.1 hypothetical protein BXY58_0872 [Epilithonimonas arachidiradicis]GGG55330.1 hypothetical protein GCM10007332_16230 [Epilithonimonas arachidiradicis]
MKKLSSILILFLSVITGIYYLYFSIKTADNTFIFDGVIYFLLIILFIVFFTITVRNDFNNFKISKKYKSFLFTAIGILIIILNIGCQLYLSSRDNSEIVLKVFYDGDYNGSSLEFRKDGTYKFGNGSGLGESIQRGKYSIKDTIITLDKDNIDNVIESKTLMLKRELNGTDAKIVQVDKNFKLIDRATKFRVVKDKR